VKKIKIIILATVVYLVFIVALLPARFVVAQFTLPDKIKLGAISGTIWSGHITSVQVDRLTLESLSWQLQLSQLLRLNLAADITLGVRTSDIKGRGEVIISGEQVSVNELTLTSTAQHLNSISPMPMGLTARGKLQLKVAHYQQAQPWCEQLEGSLMLTQGQIASNFGQVPIKQAQVALSCDNGTIVGTLAPQGNSLGIDAKVALSPQRKLDLAGLVEPPADAPQDFVNLLDFSSQRDSRGRYVLKFNTQLR